MVANTARAMYANGAIKRGEVMSLSLLLTVTLVPLLLSAAIPAGENERWACSNQIEVWCTVDSCAAKKEDETTPLSVQMQRNGAFSVCAYTGCWEGVGNFAQASGRLIWADDDVAFSTNQDGYFNADVSIMLVEKDGVGFVRVGGLATPMLCQKVRQAPPAQQ